MPKKAEKKLPKEKAEEPAPDPDPSPNPEPETHNPPPAIASKPFTSSETAKPASKTTGGTRRPRRTSSRKKEPRVWWGFGYHDKDG